MSASRIGSAICVALWLGLAAPTLAQNNDVAKAKQEYQLGYQQLQAGHFERALSHYTRSYQLVSRPRTLFNIAVCNEKLKRYKQALSKYEDFAHLAQSRDRQFVVQAKQKIALLRKRLQGIVLVVSRPSAASVFVDGSEHSVGVTPLRLTLRQGTHKLRLTLPGATTERHIEVRGQQRTTQRFTLRQMATVEIKVAPADALVRRRGDAAAKQGTYRATLRLGTHRFAITRRGYRRETIKVVLKAGHIHERVVRLRPRTGKALLLVQTNRAGARVSLDGLIVGTTSLATAPTGGRARLRHAPPAGRHTLIVESGTARWQRLIHLSPGERISVAVNFGGTSKVKTWGLAALGTLGIAVGSVLGVTAIKDVRTDMQTTHDRGKDRALLADVLLVGGVAALVSSWYLGKRTVPRASVERSHDNK